MPDGSPAPKAGESIFDIAIIGGGINGAGIARDASGRGHNVVLFEMNDLASATSQWSSKLIHGGLRYLEHYAFRLVREALQEREVLLKLAPHLIRPLRFILPHHDGLRPYWLIRLGLLIYDRLGGRISLPLTRSVDLTIDAAGAPLKPGYTRALEYSDAQVDDARLVVLNAMGAAADGAEIHVRSRVVSARRENGIWQLTVQTPKGERVFHARSLVNAAGPWVADVITDVTHTTLPAQVRKVQGSHIVTRQLFDHDRAYIFQNGDGRIIFVIPWQGEFTLIGTTDRDYQGPLDAITISDAEVAYLCAAVSEYFRNPVTPEDVVWRYSGVRPLYDDGASAAQDATRDYELKLDEDGAPLLSIFGGKITTYRRLAEEALAMIEPSIGAGASRPAGWTATTPLPGGDMEHASPDACRAALLRQYPWLPEPVAAGLVARHGALAFNLLADTHSLDDLGLDFGHGLTQAEVLHMMRREWAISTDDVLWRRTKLGLCFNEKQVARLAAWMKQENARHAA
ncbi:MAG: glycerol-3-phosphate dehydrogenase [Bosea sp. (in: a-proteobacteria)]